MSTENKSPVSPLSQVREFHEKFALPIGSQPAFPDGIRERQLRIRLLHEEFNEYRKAEITRNLVGVADALGDLVYVIYGTALSYGIDLDAVVAEIHRSNMTKTRDPEMNYPAKNVVKRAGYEPPKLGEVLGVPESRSRTRATHRRPTPTAVCLGCGDRTWKKGQVCSRCQTQTDAQLRLVTGTPRAKNRPPVMFEATGDDIPY